MPGYLQKALHRRIRNKWTHSLNNVTKQNVKHI